MAITAGGGERETVGGNFRTRVPGIEDDQTRVRRGMVRRRPG